MSTTEGGRKVTAAVASTGRAVATTSRAVGGALSQAKGALSGWWSSLTTPQPLTTNPEDINEEHHSEAEDAAEMQHSNSDSKESPDLDSSLQDSNTNGKIKVV